MNLDTDKIGKRVEEFNAFLADSLGSESLHLDDLFVDFGKKGFDFLQEGDLERAVNCIARCIEKSPEEAYNELFHFLLKLNKVKGAAAALKKAKEICPLPDYFHDRGDESFEYGNYLEAAKAYEKALNHFPDNRHLLEKIKRSLLEIREKEQASEDRGDALLEEGYTNSAKEEYQRCLQIYPNNQSVLAKLENCLVILNDTEKLELLKKGFEYLKAKEASGSTSEKIEEITKRIENVKAKKSGNNKVPTTDLVGLYDYFLDTFGRKYEVHAFHEGKKLFEKGDLNSAVNYFEVLAMRRDSADDHFYLGVTWHIIGKNSEKQSKEPYEKARASLEKAVEKRGYSKKEDHYWLGLNFLYLGVLGEANQNEKLYGQAVHHLKKSIDGLPSDFSKRHQFEESEHTLEKRFHLGSALAYLGHIKNGDQKISLYERAIDQFKKVVAGNYNDHGFLKKMQEKLEWVKKNEK